MSAGRRAAIRRACFILLAATPAVRPAEPGSIKATNVVPSRSAAALTNRVFVNGTITAVDAKTRRITVQTARERLPLAITSRTHILRTGRPAAFEGICTGDTAGLVLVKGTNDIFEAITLRLGAQRPGGGNAKELHRSGPLPVE